MIEDFAVWMRRIFLISQLVERADADDVILLYGFYHAEVRMLLMNSIGRHPCFWDIHLQNPVSSLRI